MSEQPCRDGSARLSAKCKRRHMRTHSKMKELMALAAGLPTIFPDREDVAAGGLRATGSANATPRGNEAALHGWTGRRVGTGAQLLTGGSVTHNGGGPLRITRPQKTRATNALFDARERHT
jgi:hypothetical protein